MGNSISCPQLCPKKESTPVFTSLYDYEGRTLQDLTLCTGDVLEVIAETTHWLYVRKTRVEEYTEKKSGDEANIPADPEQGYVPREFVKPLHSLEAQPWYFESITTRLEAKRCLLRPENSEGAFLVSKRQDKQQYFLSVRSGTVARHYKIQEGEGGMFFLVKRKKFHNLIELVKSYSTDPDGLCCRLEQPCVRDCPTVATLSYEEQWEVERTTLKWVIRLGSGEFGEVWSGIWNNTTPVAIKQFTALSEDIRREIQIMKELQHERLLRLCGVVTKGEPVCIITELMRNGNLSKYLKEHRHLGDIPFTLMVDFAVQVSEGMGYLESKNIVHRDLRADNILLTEMLSCKIADFGLSQFTFTGEQKISQESKVPIKWMAPEIFRGEPYTSKSDVWSFGILLMEIITYGEEPYPGESSMWCVRALKEGYRMPCPPSCPANLYDIMDACWRPDPGLRPAFLRLVYGLTNLAPESLTALE